MSTIVDISYWQGLISEPTFAAWKAAGVTRIVVKAGGGDGGALYKDSRHDANVAAARAAGLGIDHYFFNGTADPAQSAIAFLRYAAPQAGDRMWFDIENEGAMARWTPAQALAALSQLQHSGGGIAGVYMSSSVTAAADWSAVVAFGAPLWVASYGANTGAEQGAPSISFWKSYTYWQFTSVGHEPGYNGSLDIDTTNGSPDVVVPVVTTSTGYNASTTPTTTIQSELIELGYNLGASGADGVYGPLTAAAVHAFEVKEGLSVDVGIAGPQVVAKLASLTHAPTPTPAPAPTHAGLNVDGILGSKTITRWQEVLGTPQDGTISSPSALVKAVQVRLNESGARDWDGQELAVDGLGIAQNGAKTRTQWALEAHLGTPRDGVLSTPSACVAALQRSLNSGKF